MLQAPEVQSLAEGTQEVPDQIVTDMPTGAANFEDSKVSFLTQAIAELAGLHQAFCCHQLITVVYLPACSVSGSTN